MLDRVEHSTSGMQLKDQSVNHFTTVYAVCQGTADGFSALVGLGNALTPTVKLKQKQIIKTLKS